MALADEPAELACAHSTGTPGYGGLPAWSGRGKDTEPRGLRWFTTGSLHSPRLGNRMPVNLQVPGPTRGARAARSVTWGPAAPSPRPNHPAGRPIRADRVPVVDQEEGQDRQGDKGLDVAIAPASSHGGNTGSTKFPYFMVLCECVNGSCAYQLSTGVFMKKTNQPLGSNTQTLHRLPGRRPRNGALPTPQVE